MGLTDLVILHDCVATQGEIVHLIGMEDTGLFAERYRVIAVDAQNLVLRGIRSGEVVTIMNADPDNPLTDKDYPPGKLIELSTTSAN